MEANPFVGLLFHTIGGLAAASFYIPYTRVRKWNWETYWLAGGFFSWIVAPWCIAMIILPQTPEILSQAQLKTMLAACSFGAMWGIGGLTYGLTMRYLGIALGNAIALGLCAAFGTLIPPLFSGELLPMVKTGSGQVILLGVFICLAGITLSGRAGVTREKGLTDEQRKKAAGELNFTKGILVAILSGVMSASMAYGFAAGKPIAEIALQNNAPPHWQNLPVLIVILIGGFITNCIFCVRLIVKNKQAASFIASEVGGEKVNRLANYSFCALAGLTWYMQFFFYGIGTTKMGPFDFSSWTLHMASIIIFGTLWGIFLKEWKGTSRAAKLWLTAGLVLLILSMVVVGIGNKMAAAA